MSPPSEGVSPVAFERVKGRVLALEGAEQRNTSEHAEIVSELRQTREVLTSLRTQVRLFAVAILGGSSLVAAATKLVG